MLTDNWFQTRKPGAVGSSGKIGKWAFQRLRKRKERQCRLEKVRERATVPSIPIDKLNGLLLI